MMSKERTQELSELISATREHFAYLGELGVEELEFSTDPTVMSPAQPASKSSRTRTVSTLSPSYPESPNAPADALFGDLAPEAAKLEQSSETFEDVQASIGDCVRCPLSQGRTHIVHTEGNRNSRLMFVGEAPGADEDVQARPFVGRAGQLLTRIIEAIGFKREDVVIGNINRCRPPGNRPPTNDEVAMCKPFLLREIAVVQPEVIVVLGNTAMRNLLDTKESIGKLRGKFQDYKGIKVMPTFHPAYLLRDPSKKRETWDDLKKVRDLLDAKP